MNTEAVEFTQQDVEDERNAARLCESLAGKIVAKRGAGPVEKAVAESILAQSERHRERAKRIALLIGD